MRNALGPKKVKKLRRKTGLQVVRALTRGGTDHRIDLCMLDGSIKHLYKDGTIEDNDFIKWNTEGKEIEDETGAKGRD